MTIGGGRSNVVLSDESTISGGRQNTITNFLCTIGGGAGNRATGSVATIGGGSGNSASGSTSTIGGGQTNEAGGILSVVGGGNQNSAAGLSATVGGGEQDSALGDYATVPGGYRNVASGDYSFAGGRRAHAPWSGAFVWADAIDEDLVGCAENQWMVRASGGVLFYTSAGPIHNGVYLPKGSGTWLNLSSRHAKRNFRTVDGAAILRQLADLPIGRGSYTSQDPAIEHIGPTAQDFYRLFDIIDNDSTISTIDPSGIALAAIQELDKRTQRITELEAELHQLRELVSRLAEEE